MNKTIRISLLFFVALTILLSSCTPTASELLPTISTGKISSVTDSSAICGGTVITDGGTSLFAQGVCWNTTPEPTIKSYIAIDGSGISSFMCSVKILWSNTTYYVRAYATNANGTAYGSVQQITTPPKPGDINAILNPGLTYDSITDIDGNKYHTLKIGTQTWMAENLFVSKYRNGDAIPNETDNAVWNSLKTGAQCTYNNGVEPNSIAKFGRLYNYYAVTDARNIAPTGWHVASDAEWSTLTSYIATNHGISDSTAQALTATVNWTESSIVGAIGNAYGSFNNTSGFCALPAGGRYNYGVCGNVGDYTAWWTATQSDSGNAWFRSLSFYGNVAERNFYIKQYGLSVRCVKD